MLPTNNNDSRLKQIERFLEFARHSNVREHMSILNLPALARTYVRAGLNVRSMHEVHAIKSPHQLSMIDERRFLTYAEANREINLLANALEANGITRGKPVIIAVENSVEYLISWFALLRLGARVIHASYRLKPKELSYIVQHSRAKVAIVGEESLETARQLQKDEPELFLHLIHSSTQKLDRSDCVPFEKFVANSPSDAFPTRRPGAAESIVYTSGTTGKPKGAVRDLGSFGFGELLKILERLPMQMYDKNLIVTPLYHSAAQVMALIGTALGCALRIERHFDPATTIKILRNESIHSMFAIPTMLTKMVESRETPPRLPELKSVISGAAEFPHAVREKVIGFFGAEKIFDFYGATELGWVTLINGTEMLERKGSVGRAIAGQEIAVLDEDGNPLAAGKTGKVFVRSAQTMGGYLNDSKATEATKHSEWMTVDDLGYLDEQGYLYLSGRARDMVKSGGVNIYPIEIEELLMTHPNIHEVAVIGVPDKDWGERLVGIVVPKSLPFDQQDVDTFMRSRVASFKIPKQWEIVEELPRNAMGKVVKTTLRERFTPKS